jgi:stage V sporulation protein AA
VFITQKTLYLQVDTNILITHPHVYLQDIAQLSCADPELLNRLRVLQIADLAPGKSGRYHFSVTDLIDKITEKEPGLRVCAFGAADFLLTYEAKASKSSVFTFLKIVLVCLLSFFGAAFAIMTFNNDVDVPGLFSQIYMQVTGQPSNGRTILELSYSAGIGLGILFFFNHFGKFRLDSDPTPMQVQMRTYEDQVNATIIEEDGREKGV